VRLPFTKMHGCGNDFVVLDCRVHPFALDAAAVQRLGNRRCGVGFDQLLAIEPSADSSCVAAYRIWNRDGSPARQCGNGARCLAAWLQRDGALGSGSAQLAGPAGPVAVRVFGSGRVGVDMDVPDFAPPAIPLARERQQDPYRFDLAAGVIEAGAVAIGNPHALIMVETLAEAPVSLLGPQLGQAADFPEGCNVGFAELRDRGTIGLRVWERGAGETLACGSAACAAVAILRRRDAVDAEVRVHLPGGVLEVAWSGPGQPVRLAGPTAFVFEGVWSDAA
jgi:diaminopimelate epimerase